MTKPAISTRSKLAGIIFFVFTISFNSFNLLSGRGTFPTLGSIVQNGKFSAGIEDFVRALKRVDFPTLGRPTIPHIVGKFQRTDNDTGSPEVQIALLTENINKPAVKVNVKDQLSSAVSAYKRKEGSFAEDSQHKFEAPTEVIKKDIEVPRRFF